MGSMILPLSPHPRSRKDLSAQTTARGFPLPLSVWIDRSRGSEVPLPASLKRFYGSLRLEKGNRAPHVFGNLATTLDGVVAFGDRRGTGGGDITGHSVEDRALMGILRALADAVVVGAGTVRAIPRHLWTPSHIFPAWAGSYRRLRSTTGGLDEPWNVVITARGTVDPGWPVFSSGKVPAAIVTTRSGARRLSRAHFPETTRVLIAAEGHHLSALDILSTLRAEVPVRRVLVEGGPHLLGDFLKESRLGELFLTLSPQFAGNSAGDGALRLVEGVSFGPSDPRWAELLSLRQSKSHLFLRYQIHPA